MQAHNAACIMELNIAAIIGCGPVSSSICTAYSAHSIYVALYTNARCISLRLTSRSLDEQSSNLNKPINIHWLT